MAAPASALKCNDQLPQRRRVGLIYDETMCEHDTPDGDHHPECPNRIRVIWTKLKDSGLVDRCVVLNPKAAEDKHLRLVHSKDHVDFIRNISSKQFDSKRDRLASGFNSIYFNRGSSEAAYLAAGSVTEAAEVVAKGNLSSAFAIVRPPGHHAEQNEPMGFCLFNNVAVATSYLLNERPDLGVQRILIVDWDVHHGNGTQKVFWNDSRVLFFSVHRHDFGCFYPATDDGSDTMIGGGAGTGYNINVPWEHGGCGDPDYFAVWDYLLIPVVKEFKPDLIMVSAGFDAAVRDPLGGCCLTPYGYSVLLSKLIEFAQGKIVLALEGGYNLQSVADSAHACVQVLLEGKPIAGSSVAYPFESTWRVIENVRQNLSKYWPVLADELPKPLLAEVRPSQLFDSGFDSGNEDLEDIIKPLSNLKVNEGHGNDDNSNSWRPRLGKMDVWYASFGSNMWKSRFLCYIVGGQVEGMQKPCPGSMDRSPPKDILWRIVNRRLLFGRDYTHTWGAGGVAFLHPMSCSHDKAYICMYRITLEQFNDVLHQENRSSYDMNSPLFDDEALENVRSSESASVEPLKQQQGWYHNVVYLGDEQGIPILTMTCDIADIENFRSGKLPLRAPGKEYANTLIRGLVEGKQLTQAEAGAYIDEAAAKPL